MKLKKQNMKNKNTGKKERIQSDQDFAVRAVNTVETIKGTVGKKAAAVKDTASHAAYEASKAIKKVHKKSGRNKQGH